MKPFMPIPSANAELRKQLLDYFLEVSTAQELGAWLRDINQETKGTREEKQERIRQNTKYLSMPPETFPHQTMNYLAPLASEHLADICEDLGLSPEGSRAVRYRRIMREVHFREGWLVRPSKSSEWCVDLVEPFIRMYPIIKRGQYERDFYGALEEELIDVFGAPSVHSQLAIAHGTTLKIDFHIGPASGSGVGIEVKMPANNSDLQKAIGQLDQYRELYGANLILLLLPDFITEAQKQLFLATTASRGIVTVER